MANIIPFNQRIKAAVRVLRGRTSPRQSIIRIGEEKKMPLVWPDFRTGIAQWHVIDLANYIQEGFQGNSLIYSAIMYKARAQMQVPLRAYKGDPGQPELLPPNDPLAHLCARPNFHQSYPEMAMQAMTYFNVAGECFFVFDRPLAGGMPINILCLRPDRMHIIPAKNKKRLVGYVYTPENVPVSKGLRILPQDVMHVKLPNPGDPLEGMGHGLSPIAAMAKSADVDNDITDFLKLFFERGVMIPGILTTEMPLDDFTIARIRERWKEMYGGHQAWAEEIGVMDSNTKYQRIGLNFSEMGFDSLDERNEARILGPFGVPPSLIATRLGMAAATESNRETDRKQCWEDTLIPELVLFEREWQYYLQGDAGGWVAYDYSDVVALQEDKVALIAAALQLWTMGTPANLAVSEVGLTMEPIPGGDVGYLPMGMIPVASSAQAMLPAPTSTPAPDAEDEERQETTKKGSSPSARSGGHSRLTEPIKQLLAKKADVIAWKWTPAFTRMAREQFEIDHRELSAAVTAAGKKSIQEKATINWQWLQREWMEIFALAGERWREAFLPGIEGVMIDQGESLNFEFGVQWNVRNLFAEDWFTEYMGEFSKGIVETTRDEMNAVLAQGMREGWSIPTTQKHLTQIFETWQGKVPKPGATWDWLEQRLPSNRTEMIARTETIRASARGSQGIYKGWGLNAKEWLTTEDDRLCDWCRPLNGTIIAIDDAFFGKGSVYVVPSSATQKPISMNLNYEDVQGPPLHVLCRCSLMPVIPEEGLAPEAGPEEAVAGQPMGTPVSQGLNLSGLPGMRSKPGAAIRNTVVVIDNVHGDGDLPETPVKLNASTRRSGGYVYNLHTGKPIEIRVSRKTEHPMLTTAHEVGHFIAAQGFGADPPEAVIVARDEWYTAVRASKAYKALEELQTIDSVRATYTTPSGLERGYDYRIDKSYIRYLMGGKELWARSYAQYIANKSGNQAITDELTKTTAIETRGDVYYPQQWDADDFAPIEAAIDKLFKIQGWVG